MPASLVRRLTSATALATLTSLAAGACLDPAGDAADGEVTTAPAALVACGDGVAAVGELCLGAPTRILGSLGPLGTVIGADVDGDGHRDLVAASAARMYVLLGTGVGFGAYSWFQPPAGSVIGDITVGDFDADGELDVAMSDTSNDRLIVRYHTGGAGFGAPVYLPAGDAPTRILAAHLNGDARADLVVLNRDDDTIHVRLATPGGFAAAVSYPVGDATDLAVGDCDGTGRPDVMYLNGQGTATVLLARRNDGNGGLVAPLATAFPLGPTPTIPFYSHPLALVSGRMNGDIFDDVVVSASESRMSTGRSNGNCLFTRLPEIQTWAWTYRLRLADHDGNGTLDVTAPHGTGAADDRLSLVFGVGNGGLVPTYGSLVQPLGTVFNDVAVADWDGDGASDLVTASASGLLLFRGKP